MANFLDNMFDSMEQVVGGLEKSKQLADDKEIAKDKDENIIDAEFEESESGKLVDSRMKQDPSHRLMHLRVDLYGALQNCKGQEKEEFKKLISEISDCIKLGM